MSRQTSRNSRAGYVREIEDRIGKRKLYWFGPRGADGQALLSIDQFDGSFSLMAPLEAVSVAVDISLESLTRERVDHNTYDLDSDHSEAVQEFRARLLETLSQPCAIVPYRPNRFLSNICFPRAATAQHLGLFYEHQSQFEHKPWVESELHQAGVQVLPWRYFADEDRPRLREFLANNQTIVLRASRSDGGARVELIEDEVGLDRHAPEHDDGFLSACRFFDPAIPLNLNGCVFRTGEVVLSGLSEQVIGRRELVARRFGYCGNRFRRQGDWPSGLVEQFDHQARLCGRWLHSQGYRGLFGIDALFADGQIYIVEINPRFQGSTWAVAEGDRRRGRVDLYLCQVAVELGLDAPELPPLDSADTADEAGAMLIAHNLEDSRVRLSRYTPGALDRDWRVDLLPREVVLVDPGAVLGRILTSDGGALTTETICKNLAAIETERRQNDLFA